ncbi:hypothetical protein GQ457_12G032560 [Hibiscus cannabinus]
MAEFIDGAEFWLPAKFLAEEDGVLKAGNGGRNDTESLVSAHVFPTEFPYEFSTLSSPVESVVESTETESSDEDEFLAGFTRRLAYSTSQKLTVPTLYIDKNEKNGALGNSPRSTLSGLGCSSSNGPSQVPSPPTTPFCAENVTWDLIYAAAREVARLKMSNEVPKYTNFSQGKAFPFNQTQTNQFNGRQVKPSNWQQQQIQTRLRNNVVGERFKPMGLPQSSWPPLQVHSQPKQHPQNHPGSGMRAVFLGGSDGVKRPSAGTGVFIPRRYDNNNNNNNNHTNTTIHEPRKKPGCSTVLLPAKVVQALNLNFDETNNSHVQPQFNPGHVQPQFNPGFASNFDALVARRNALLGQARRNFRQEGTLNLPQEWTY